MSVARSSECLFCSFLRSPRPASIPRRQFHPSPLHEKRKPRFPSLKANVNEVDLNQASKEFPSSQNAIPQHYSPEQRAAIEAAQNLIDLERLEKQTGMRTDPWKMKYYDELTKIDPVVDKPVLAPWSNTDDNSRMKTEDELEEDMIKFMNEIPEPKAENENDFDAELWDRFDKNLRLTVGREEAERHPRTAIVPDLPPMSEVAKPKKEKKKSRSENDGEGEDGDRPRGGGNDATPALLRLMQMTGFSRKTIAGLRVKTIIRHRVVNQTRLGKIDKMYCLTVAGNGQGLIGIGEGKAAEMDDARLQSQYRAIRNMRPILRYEDRTIYGDVDAKVSATELELYARPPGMYLDFTLHICLLGRVANSSPSQGLDFAVNSISGRFASAQVSMILLPG